MKEQNIDSFDIWNNLKKDIHINKNRIHFRQGEIWFVHIGQNIGYEVFGKGEEFLRPVVVFRKVNKSTFLAIPLTSKIKDDKFHCVIKFKDKQNSAMLTQVKTIDAKRLAYKAGIIEKKVFEKLERSFVDFYDLTPLARGGYTHLEDEQRIDSEILAKHPFEVNKPTISIITVVWNNAKTIKDAIDSVLGQTYKNIEYIVVDGASSDGTVEIVQSYGERISKFVSEPDRGLYDAMNKGIALATGDVVGILNSDDFYNSNDILETVANEFMSKDIDCLYGDLEYVDANDTSKVVRYWKSKAFEDGLFQKGWHPAHPTFFIKREFYEKYGVFNLNYKIAADYEIMLRFLQKYKISSSYIPKVFVKMRLGGESNRSLTNIVKANLECYKAWHANQLKVNLFILLLKPISKILQYKMPNDNPR